jgi:hypothetical protein
MTKFQRVAVYGVETCRVGLVDEDSRRPVGLLEIINFELMIFVCVPLPL